MTTKKKRTSTRTRTAPKKQAAGHSKAADSSSKKKSGGTSNSKRSKTTAAKKAAAKSSASKKAASRKTAASRGSGKSSTSNKPGKAAKPSKPGKTAKPSKPGKTAKPAKTKIRGAKKPAAKENTPAGAKGAADSKKTRRKVRGRSSAAKQSVSSLIPSPTKEVLRPFREAAKRNKQLQKEKDKSTRKRAGFLAKPTRKGKKYTVDLRVHTPASLGFFSTGGVDPAPALVRLARVKGLDIIGLTDYYSTQYIDRVRECAEETKITVLPGFDMRCRVEDCDEISAVALFPPTHTGAMVREVMDALDIPESAHGRPDYVVEQSLEEILHVVEANDGIVIPSRIDKTPYRHLAIPALVEKHGFHAFDLVHHDNPDFFRERWPSGGFTFFSFSNANALGQIGSRTAEVRLTYPGFDGLKELVQRRDPDGC